MAPHSCPDKGDWQHSRTLRPVPFGGADARLKEDGQPKKTSTLATDKGRIERHIKPLLGRMLVAGRYPPALSCRKRRRGRKRLNPVGAASSKAGRPPRPGRSACLEESSPMPSAGE